MRPAASQLAEGGYDDPGLVAQPARILAERGLDVQLVEVGVVAYGAPRPPADLSVEHAVLDVLRHLSGHVGGSVGPLADPPAPLGDDVLQHVDRLGRVEAACAEIVEHPGAGLEQRIGAHRSMVPAAPTPRHAQGLTDWR